MCRQPQQFFEGFPICQVRAPSEKRERSSARPVNPQALLYRAVASRSNNSPFGEEFLVLPLSWSLTSRLTARSTDSDFSESRNLSTFSSMSVSDISWFVGSLAKTRSRSNFALSGPFSHPLTPNSPFFLSER